MEIDWQINGSHGNVIEGIFGEFKLAFFKQDKRVYININNFKKRYTIEKDFLIGFWGKTNKVKELLDMLYPKVKKQERKMMVIELSKFLTEIGNELKKVKPEISEDDYDIVQTSMINDEDYPLTEEIVTEEGIPKFAYLSDGEPHYAESIEIKGIKYIPKEDHAIEKKAVLLPTAIGEYNSTAELLNEIQIYIYKYLDIEEKYVKLASWYVMMTWVYDRLNTLPYLRALGDTGTGKSRFLDVIGKICYRPITISGAVTPAPIYRLIEQWKGTLLIDEADMKNSDIYNEVVTILNCGFEKGKPVIRCPKNEPNNIQFFNTFGPKIIATRREFQDKALESRCLTEKMRQTTRDDLPDQLPDEFFEKGKQLRNKLLRFRLENWSKVDVKRSQEVDLKEFEPRLRQATRCFMAIFDDKTVLDELKQFLSKHQNEIIDQRSSTWEGIVVNILYDIWLENEGEMENEYIYAKLISQLANEKYNTEKLKPNTVGKILKSLNIETKHKRFVPKGETKKVQYRIIDWNEEHMEILFKRYVPNYIGGKLMLKMSKSIIRG